MWLFRLIEEGNGVLGQICATLLVPDVSEGLYQPCFDMWGFGHAKGLCVRFQGLPFPSLSSPKVKETVTRFSR